MRVLTLALLAFVATPAAAEERNFKVDVDGNTYRVFVRDDEVKVFNKSAATRLRMGRSLERKQQSREAVRRTTGCELVNDFWMEYYLLGKLDCTGPVTPPPPSP